MAFLSLYRKYRPLKFSDLVGQEHVVKTLTNALKNGRISHAYLFAGPRGTGKTSTAKVFASSLNCTGDSSIEPCGNCQNCVGIKNEQSIDVMEIDAASNRGINEIRDLREKVKFYPGEGKYKVYIIDEVHMLTTEAFNALLKTLEEPPENVIFILATTEPHKIISTIHSRCQRFDFSLLSVKDIRGRLKYICEQEDVEYEEGALSIIAHSSDGGMRDAISILDQAISFTDGCLNESELRDMLGKVEEEVLNQMIEYIKKENTADVLKLVNEFIESGKGVDIFVSDLIEHIRRLLLIKKCGIDSGLVNFSRERLELLKKESKKIEISNLIRIIDILTDIEKDLKYTEQSRLMLEMGMVKLTSPAGKGLEERVNRLEERFDKLEDMVIDDDSEVVKKKVEKNTDNKAKKDSGLSKDDEEDSRSEKNIKKRKKDEEKRKNVSKKGSDGNKIDFVRKQWSHLLSKLKEKDIRMEAVIREGKPWKIEDNVLYIKFPEGKNFHKKRAREQRDMAARVINRVLDTSLSLRMISEGEGVEGKKNSGQVKSEKKSDGEDEFVKRVIEAFDGEEIEANTNIIDQN